MATTFEPTSLEKVDDEGNIRPHNWIKPAEQEPTALDNSVIVEYIPEGSKLNTILEGK